MAQRNAPKSEQDLVGLARKKAQRYLNTEGVTSVGVGFRQKRNEKTGQNEVTKELCIQFTVAEKLSPEALNAKNIPLLPVSFDFDDGDVAKVDVVERTFQVNYEIVSDPEGDARARELSPWKQRRSRLDPVVPGISVSHRRGTAGTIGAIVYDNRAGIPLLLSNWHVLHSTDDPTDTNILQPGPSDSSDLDANRIGRLLRSHLGLAGDCAVATIEDRRFAEEIFELNVVPKRAAKVSLGDTVVKSGRTTGVTFGIVTRVGVTANIHYGGVVGAANIGCFEIRPNPKKPPKNGEISQGGDSGSIWLIDGDDNDKDVAVGLHFAGEVDPHPADEHSLACNIHSVLEKLDVSFVDVVSSVATDEELWNTVLARLQFLENQSMLNRRRVQGPKNSTQVAPEDGFPVHGNWCGPGHGGGQPIDTVDQACMEHDKCYDREGYWDCGCDSRLLGDLSRAITSSRLSPEGRLAATAISAWFSAQPCVKWFGKIPIPLGTGLTTRVIDQGTGFVKKLGDGLWKVIRSIG